MEKRRSVKRFERVDLICDECGSIVEHSGMARLSVDDAIQSKYVCSKCGKEYEVPFPKQYPYLEPVSEKLVDDKCLFRVDFDNPYDGTLDTTLVVDCSHSHAKRRVEKEYNLGKDAYCWAREVEEVDGYKIKLVEE